MSSLSDLSQLEPGLNFVLKDRTYTVLDCFYRGTFSTVYKLLSREDDDLLVMKVESKKGYNNTRTVLKLDVTVLEELAWEKGFAQIRAVARTENWKVLVMDYVGHDLFKLQQALLPNTAFSPRTVLHIAWHVLDRLEVLHSRGWLHRDLKAGNLSVGQDGRIYLLDFGMARRFKKDDKHLAAREVGPYCGTFEFSSLSSSCWQDMSPRDDLENWFFMTIHMLKGRLPWSDVPNPSIVRDMKNWAVRERTSDLFGGISPGWEDIYTTIEKARPMDNILPVLRQKLRRIMLGVNMTEPLDWESNPTLRELMADSKEVVVAETKKIKPLGDGLCDGEEQIQV